MRKQARRRYEAKQKHLGNKTCRSDPSSKHHLKYAALVVSFHVWPIFFLSEPVAFPTPKRRRRNTANNQTTPKAKEHTQTQPTNQKHTPKKQSEKWSAVQFSDYRWGWGDSIASTQVLLAKNKKKREHRNTNITLPYRRVSEATYAETRDPPSQDPRDQIEQAIKA